MIENLKGSGIPFECLIKLAESRSVYLRLQHKGWHYQIQVNPLKMMHRYY